jgi:GTP-binding protein Era
MNTDSTFKSGFVAVAGRPNVGKSTLINALLGQKVAAVSPRPQTTRRDQLGILTLPDAQIVFMDTPGIHHPRHKLGEIMNREAQSAIEDADLVLFLVDASVAPDDEDRLVAERLAALQRGPATILLLNKIDLLNSRMLPEREAAYQALLPEADRLPISAARGDNRDRLVEKMLARLPVGGAFYPEDQITDLYEREIAADLVREAALLHLRDEIPHGIAVRIDEYKERSEETAYIAATIFIERESHKPIVIGQGGLMLKKIGTTARQEIEAMSGRKVFLELRVKVQKGWRDDEQALKRMGFAGRKPSGDRR